MSKSKALKPVEAKSYGYFSALYRSFYSSNLYVDVGKRWKGLGLIYFLLMIAVFSIPAQMLSLKKFNQMFDEQIESFKLIPTVFIQEGKVSFNKPMPYKVKDNKGKVKVIIDTTGKITHIDSKKYPDLAILLTKDTLFYKMPHLPIADLIGVQSKRGIISEDKLTEDMTQVFNGKEWIDEAKLNNIKIAALIIIPFAIFFFFWGFCLVILLSFALFGQVLARGFFDFFIGYKQSSRIMTVAATPATLLFFIVVTTGINIPFTGVWALVVLTFYYCFAIISLKKDSQKVARQ